MIFLPFSTSFMPPNIRMICKIFAMLLMIKVSKEMVADFVVMKYIIPDIIETNRALSKLQYIAIPITIIMPIKIGMLYPEIIIEGVFTNNGKTDIDIPMRIIQNIFMM